MSSCAYFSCFKGILKCSHPEYGKLYTPLLSHGRCEICKRNCKGIYPSQLPRYDTSNLCIDVVDEKGKVLKTLQKGGD